MFRRRSQDDFEDEIRSHLQIEVDRLKAQGMSEADAERAAHRNFGNVGVAEDRFYHAQPFARLEDAMRDMRHGWRSLLRAPGFLATAVVTLALAIGAVAGMFDVVNTVMLRSLPYPHADRIMWLDGSSDSSFPMGPEFYLQYKERATTLDGIFAFGGGTSTFRTDTRVERISMNWATNDIYSVLGVKPQLGRLPAASDGDDVALISDQLWSTWFGRDPSVIGKWYFVSDSMKQIIGVLPPDATFPGEQTMLWVATPVRPEDIRPGTGSVAMVARLKEGVTREQAATELTKLAKEIPSRFGGSPAFARRLERYRSVLTPLREAMLGPTATTSLWVLFGAVVVVLLIACANVANLFMVRAESRRRDLTVRRAIGASRAQLVRFQMAESFVVALAAGVVAVLLCTIALPLFLRAAPEGLPRLAQTHLDATTLGATFLLVVLVALACGAWPALRGSAPDLSALRDGDRGNTGRGHLGRDILVIGQTALALVLLIASALLMQSFQRLRHVDPGYRIKDLYTFQFAPDQPTLRDGPSLGRMHLTMMDRIRALPGVTGVGIVNNIPLDESTGSIRVRTEGMPADAEGTPMRLNVTGGDYFGVMGIKLLQGRTFTTNEAVTPNNSVIVSRAAADALWPGRNPLGQSLRPRIRGTDTLAFNVVGVVNDVKQLDWRDASELVLYFPLTGPSPTSWAMGSPAYVVQSPRGEALKPEIRGLVREIAPEAPVYREFTLEFLARRSMIQLSFTTLTLGVVSVLALVLGAVGLYGVLSYVVAQRTREIGVRMALGATAATVRRQVVSQGAKVVLAGVVLGAAAALASTRLLGTLLYGVKAADPLVFAAMSLMMVGMGVLASYVPARRASNVNPIEALRSD